MWPGRSEVPEELYTMSEGGRGPGECDVLNRCKELASILS